jgi:hypothetical protein
LWPLTIAATATFVATVLAVATVLLWPRLLAVTARRLAVA